MEGGLGANGGVEGKGAWFFLERQGGKEEQERLQKGLSIENKTSP